MTTFDAPVFAVDLRVEADHGQIYIYSDAVVDFADESEPLMVALDDAYDTGRYVGVVPGLLDIITPGTRNADTPMRVEVWAAEPPADTDDWLQEVDADLDVPDGILVFEASGFSEGIPQDVPPGSYRVRVSGAGFTERGDAGADGDDYYRLRLWPRTADTEPVLRKCWDSWGD